MQLLPAYLFVCGGALVALICTVIGTFVIVRFRRKDARGHRGLFFGVHVIAMLAVAALAGFLGLRFGIAHFCFAPGAGAQCGLAAVFIVGPIAFGVGAIAYAAVYAIRDRL